jgi:hypothetical protein
VTDERDQRPTGRDADPAGSAPAGPTPVPRPSRDEPVLPDVAPDDTDRGWGDEPSQRDADWYERERPPHHE